MIYRKRRMGRHYPKRTIFDCYTSIGGEVYATIDKLAPGNWKVSTTRRADCFGGHYGSLNSAKAAIVAKAMEVA